VSDELGCLAHPRPNLDGRNHRALFAALTTFAAEEGVRRFLVGWPLEMTGEQGVAAQRAARFAEQLAAATGVEVELVDERWTSVQAERGLRAGSEARGMRGRARIRAHVDAESATIILQHWLDAHAPRAG
jgi:putative Holliday junction resolvase